MGVGIYTRVSTDGQKDNTSIENQIEACTAKAQQLGFNQVDLHIYTDEGESGEYIDRPALNALRRDIEHGIISQAVIFLRLDRMGRSLSHQLTLADEFEKNKISLHFADGDYDRNTQEGKIFFAIFGVMSEIEKDKIRERTIVGRLRRAKEGFIMPMRCSPYGYSLQDKKLFINDEEAKIVRNIYDWYNGGETMRGIGKRLIEMGAEPRLSHWNASTIRNILSSETYIGTFKYNRRKHTRIPGKKTVGGNPAIFQTDRPESEHVLIAVPPIIDEVTYYRAQAQKVNNTIFNKRKTKLDYLARGRYLRCSNCGRVLQATSYTAKHKDGTELVGTYRCPNLNPRSYDTPKCQSSSIRSKFLDTYIWLDLTAALMDPDNVKYVGRSEVSKIDFSKEKERLNLTQKKLQEEKDRVVHLYRKDLMSEDDVERHLGEIKRKEQGMAQQWQVMIAAEEESQKAALSDNDREVIFKQIKPLLIDPTKLSFDDKQQIFTLLVDHVKVTLRPGYAKMEYDGVFSMVTEHTYISGQRHSV
ncbi:MAG TPA: recombinase family protein [Desulfosporosinus sp.]